MENKIFTDFRGFNMKFFEEHLAKEEGFREVCEVYATTNKQGVIRAFHWQGSTPETTQQKIVKPLAGKFNLRLIDMENEVIYEYNEIDNTSDPIFAKSGMLLGYVALEENSVMLYIADNKFISEENMSINPFSFGNDWNTDLELIVNDRDNSAKQIDSKYKRIVMK